MNIIDNLLSDHDLLRNLMEEIESKLSTDSVIELLGEFDILLNQVHEPKEEEVFLSAITTTTESESEILLKGLISEHQILKDQIKDIISTLRQNPSDINTIKVILPMLFRIKAHMQQEETVFYPIARQHVTEASSQEIINKYHGKLPEIS